MKIPKQATRLLTRNTTTTTASAHTIAAQFAQLHLNAPPTTVREYLHPKQMDALAASLGHSHMLRSSNPTDSHHPGGLGSPRSAPSSPAVEGVRSELIPPGWHLAYFTPVQLEALLGADGTDTSFNPPAPFTRRMWAGGEIVWGEGLEEGLRVGEECVESTRLLGAEAKVTRKGEEMVVVGVEKRFEQGGVVKLVDRRNWIFRPAITVPLSASPAPATVPFPEALYTQDFCQTPVSLFRFSALTFNGHKIHYCKEWCVSVEGHRDCVVHGPLNLINILNFWTDVHKVMPKSVKYRATSPLYVGESYRACMEEEREGVTDVNVVDSFGVVCMKASVKRGV